MSLATERSGVSCTAVVLPKGGGALHGIGETFKADPQSGTYQVSVPIALPEGRRGATPGIDLRYSSGTGNGPFGLGWTLGILAVMRSTRRRIPRYDDNDEFQLNRHDLTPVGTWTEADGRRERTYRLSGDRAYERVVRVRADQQEWWEVTTTSGITTLLGRTGESQLRDTSKDHIRVFGWFATRTTDTVGNSIEYRYRTDGSHRQLYLCRIDYADLPSGEAGAGGWLYSVVLDYGQCDEEGNEISSWDDQRTDAFSTFRSGFEIRTARRCGRIFVVLNGATSDARADVISRYDLTYETAEGNAVSLMHSITKIGVRRTNSVVEEQSEPPIEFGYSAWKPASGQVTEYSGSDVPRIARDRDVELLDGQGYGCPGMVIYTGKRHQYLDIDPAGALRLRGEQSGPANHPIGQDFVHLGDMTGDGYVDLTRLESPWGYYRAIPGVGWSARLTELGDAVPFAHLLDNGRLADLDGDGATDFIGISAGRFHVYYNLGTRGWSAPAETRFPADCDPDFNDPDTRLADMSGDGPVDYVRVGDPCVAEGYCHIMVKYWPHHGHGDFGDQAREMPLPLLVTDSGTEDPFAVAWLSERLLLTDVDGDGYSDAVLVRENDVVVWLNQAGNRFGTPARIPLRTLDNPEGDDLGPRNDEVELSSLRVADLGGRGTVGVLWSPVGSATRLRWAPLTRDTKPYLLTSVRDHRGAAAAIGYRSSAAYAYDDAARGPNLAWRTHLPFPVQLVEYVCVSDEFSERSVTSRYRYHEGVWDGTEREFRGFAQVDRYDAAAGGQAGHSTPVLTRMWFHTGVAGPAADVAEPQLRGYWTLDPPLLSPSAHSNWLTGLNGPAGRRALRALSGKPRRTETYAAGPEPEWVPGADDRPYSVTEYAYDLDRVADGPGGLPVTAALRRGERVTQWERGLEPMTRVQYELLPDRYGRPGLLVDIAVPRGRDAHAVTGEDYLVTVTNRRYASAAENYPYILDRVAADVRYELTGERAGPPDDLAQRIETTWPTSPGAFTRRVIGATASYYDGAAFTGEELGKLGVFGLMSRRRRLVHTPETLAAVFTEEALPPWVEAALTPAASTQSWPAYYPDRFRRLMDAQTKAGGGYTGDGAPDDDLPSGLYRIEVARRHDTQPEHLSGSGPNSAPASVRFRRGLVLASRDAAGVETVVEADEHWLYPRKVTTAGVIEESMIYDYRAQQPAMVTDSNGYRTRFTYTPLGLLHTVVRTGPADDDHLGDTPDQPGIVYAYGLNEYDDSPPDRRRPVWVHSRTQLLGYWTAIAHQRTYPAAGLDLRLHGTAERRDYSDGLDRLLQSRTLRTSGSVGDPGLLADIAEPPTTARVDPPGATGERRHVGGWTIRGTDGVARHNAAGTGLDVAAGPADPLVRVDGWVAYDDKGRVVEEYEPFLDEGWAYNIAPSPRRHGTVHRQLIRRDPRGIPQTITNADGTQRHFVHGQPADLAQPDRFEPSPWVAYEYDVDDNARRTHPNAHPPWHAHSDTPASVEVDPLGRIVTVTERLRDDPEQTPEAQAPRTLITSVRRDIDGNVTRVTDARDHEVYRAVYDLLGRAWSETTPDTGTTLIAYDALGAPVEVCDARSVRTLNAYDTLHRFARRWTVTPDAPIGHLQYAVLYGDDPAAPADAAQRNLRGRRWRSYDPAGVTVHERYDVHNHPQELVRRWRMTDDLIGSAAHWPPEDPIRADSDGDRTLDPRRLHVRQTCDRTGAVHSLVLEGSGRPVLAVRYIRDSSGAVTAVDLHRHGDESAERLVHQLLVDAHGKPVLIERLGDLTTQFRYDPLTTMLLRQHTGLTDAADRRHVLHDAAMQHDPLGAVTRLDERSPAHNGLQTQTFSYDDLHRLTSVTGSARARPTAAPWDPPSDDPPQPCRRTYCYDDVGNLIGQLLQVGDRTERRLTVLQPGSSRVETLTIQAGDAEKRRFAYRSDKAGHIVREGPDREFTWNAAGLLDTARAGASKATHRYTDAGQHTAVVLATDGTAESATHYLQDWVTCTCEASGGSTITITATADGSPSGAPLAWVSHHHNSTEIQNLVTDHLGSIRAVLHPDGTLLQATDYSPHGETLVRVSSGPDSMPRPLGYAAAEEDKAANLLLLGQRPYAPWLGRFIAPEPRESARAISTKALSGLSEPGDPPDHRVPAWAASPYTYAANSPLMASDADGAAAVIVDAARRAEPARTGTARMPTGHGASKPSATGQGKADKPQKQPSREPKGGGPDSKPKEPSVVDKVRDVGGKILDAAKHEAQRHVDREFTIKFHPKEGFSATFKEPSKPREPEKPPPQKGDPPRRQPPRENPHQNRKP
ncbi:SpvB/TcaC N-terminal domain-containing protein [Actinoplanes aureus]|uniref:Uncharacterized protein n=1 Tax=Actinoplanes aureus TaxID=2792083 RepID=A0A931CHM5_9ACTN|nr:SpvB/TcaC N-terminal domain-containing protein [Actinoplanes aureus]MBG0568789.1 hypothetical protein [Actinoplanes aureus]